VVPDVPGRARANLGEEVPQALDNVLALIADVPVRAVPGQRGRQLPGGKDGEDLVSFVLFSGMFVSSRKHCKVG
jgi:hypothetical protein